MQQEFYFRPNTLLELNELLEYFDKYQTPLIEREILILDDIAGSFKRCTHLCVVAHLSEGGLAFGLAWEHDRGEQISLKKMRMLAHQDAYPRAYDQFSYKFEVISEEQYDKASLLSQSIGFELKEDLRALNERSYFSISIDQITKDKMYQVDSCELSFWRNNSFVTTDFEHFCDIVWLIKLLGRAESLTPIDLNVGIFA